jgi:hypothetical protein
MENSRKIKVVLANSKATLPSRDRTKVTNGIHEISKKKWKHIPIEEFRKAFSIVGLILLQEDDTPYQGMFLGEKGEARLAFGYADNPEQVQQILLGDADRELLNTQFVPIKNSRLILQWYKDVGMTAFEINAYLS